MDKYQISGLGKRIAKLRKSKNITQEVLAEKTSVSSKHISHIERDCASVSICTLVELCVALDCSLDYLVLGESNNEILQYLPETVLEILHSGNDAEIGRLQKYLELYVDYFSTLEQSSKHNRKRCRSSSKQEKTKNL